MGKALIKWQEPKEICKKQSEFYLTGCWRKFFKMMSIGIIVTAIVFFAMSKLPVEKGFLERMPWMFLYIIMMCAYVFIIAPYLTRFSRAKYEITDKGIRSISGNKGNFYRWNKITNYEIREYEEFPGLKVLWITYLNRQKKIFLSAEINLDKLLLILSANINKKNTTPPKTLDLSKAEKIYIGFFTLGWCILILCSIEYLVNISKYLGDFGPLILLPSILLGPGTLIILQLRGLKGLKHNNGFSTAMSINLICMTSCLIAGIIIMYIRFYKIFN